MAHYCACTKRRAPMIDRFCIDNYYCCACSYICSKTSISIINKYMQKAKEPENDAGFLKHITSETTVIHTPLSQHTLLIDRSIVAINRSIDFCASIYRSIDCIRAYVIHRPIMNFETNGAP